MDKADTDSRFFLAGAEFQHTTTELALAVLRGNWELDHHRQLVADAEWTSKFSTHLDHLVNLRIEHVREWVSLNLSRFQTGHANIEELRRTFDAAIVDLKASVQLCKAKCFMCHLLCVQSRWHEGGHDCQTRHICIHTCEYCDDDSGPETACNIP